MASRTYYGNFITMENFSVAQEGMLETIKNWFKNHNAKPVDLDQLRRKIAEKDLVTEPFEQKFSFADFSGEKLSCQDISDALETGVFTTITLYHTVMKGKDISNWKDRTMLGAFVSIIKGKATAKRATGGKTYTVRPPKNKEQLLKVVSKLESAKGLANNVKSQSETELSFLKGIADGYRNVAEKEVIAFIENCLE